MKLILQTLALSAGFLLSAHGFAQTSTATPPAKPASSAPAPATATGGMTTKPAGSATTTTTTQSQKETKSTTKMPTTAAAGGGDGKVWVNTASKTYHCAGTKYYGKTKAGEYMSEADAKAKGNHPDHKKVCS